MRQELFEELQRGRMIENLRVDPATAGPGAGDDQRDAKAETDRALAVERLGKAIPFLFLGVRHKIHAGVDPGRDLARPFLVRMRRGERRNVIEIAVVLIVSKDENRLLPDLGIVCKDIHHLGNVPRAIPCRGGMIGEVLRRAQPGDQRWAASPRRRPAGTGAARPLRAPS